MKKFKSKKQSKFRIKYILIILIIYFISKFTFNFFNSYELKMNDKSYLNFLISQSNKLIKYEIDKENITSNIIKFISNIDINKPSSIIDDKFNNVVVTKTNIETDKYVIVSKSVNYIDDPNPVKVSSPLVYLYNTHQLEEYKKNELYGVSPNVMVTSFMLKDNLNKAGINTIVEERKINEILNINNWSNFYKASRYLLQDTISKNKSLKYYIDIHRDSVREKYTTLTIGTQRFAKLYFVIGKENKNYTQNMNLAKLLDVKLNSKYNGISKGILLKEGKGVNGIYNQDIDKNVLLIEFGGVDNTIEEVLNSVNVFSSIFNEVINEKQ